jgi:hypothetical protein
MSRNLGASNSLNTVGLFRPVMGQFYLYLYLAIPIFTEKSRTSYEKNQKRGNKKSKRTTSKLSPMEGKV